MMRPSWIITIVACGLWRWLVQQSLQFYRLRITTILVLIGLSMIGVTSIIMFPHLYHQLLGQGWRDPLTLVTGLQYVGYIVATSIVVSLIVFRRYRSVFVEMIILVALLLVINFAIPWIGGYVIWYVLLAASIEEYVKYYLGSGAFRNYGVTGSDLVLFAVLSGLGFACIENIVYLVQTQSTNLAFGTMMRWMVGPIVHMVCSGILAYGYWYLRRQEWGRVGLIASGLGAILIHAGYNTLARTSHRGLILIIIIIGYAILSWVLYQCDRLYFESKNNLKITPQSI